MAADRRRAREVGVVASADRQARARPKNTARTKPNTRGRLLARQARPLVFSDYTAVRVEGPDHGSPDDLRGRSDGPGRPAAEATADEDDGGVPTAAMIGLPALLLAAGGLGLARGRRTGTGHVVSSGPEVHVTSLRSTGTDAAARADAAWELLSAVGARRTVARVQVIKVLAAVDGHVSVTTIHERIAAAQPEINVSTVHRTIGYLLEHGVVHILSWPGERLYGLADQPHHHAVCASCGAIDELPAAPLAAAAAAAGTGSTLEIDGATVTLSGLCRACRDR